MDGSLSAEQAEFARSCRRMLADRCSIDVVRAAQGPDGDGHDRQLWAQLAGAGWLALPLPEDVGGYGASLVDLGIACQEAGRALVPTTLYTTLHAALLVDRLGTADQRAALLPGMVDGELLATVAFAEAQAIHSPQHLATSAEPTGSGWCLRGAKAFVGNGTESDVVVVAARPGDGDLAFFTVETGEPGMAWSAHETFGRDRQHRLVLDGVHVERGARLGGAVTDEAVDRAWRDVEQAMTALTCMDMLGGMQSVLDRTVEHVSSRHVFGRPIGAFQAAQHLLADAAIDVKGAEVTAYQALWRLSEGLPAAREVAIAKTCAGRAYKAVTVLAHQLHGGMGYVRETDLHLWSNRAVAMDAAHGSGDLHLRRLMDRLDEADDVRGGGA